MMRTQKDWISFKTKFRGVAIRKGFRPALAGPRPSEEALMVPDPSDATGCSQVPETPNQIAARLAQWDTANSLCWAYLQDYCDDEAASVLRGCRDEDGRHGWESGSQDWLELKRRRRERKHESGDMPRCKRQRADNSSDDEE